MAAPLYVLFARGRTTNSTTEEVVGQFYWNSTEHPGVTSVTFRAVASVTAGTGTIELYNVSDAEVVSTLTFTGTDFEMKEEASVALGTPKIYEVRIKINSAANNITLGSAGLVLDS